jgi:hypothetical protein
MPCCLLSATHQNSLTDDNQLKKKPKKNTPQKKKLPIDYCSSAVIVFSPQFENIPNLYKKPVPYQLGGRRVPERIKEVIESNKVLHFVSHWCDCCQSQ